MIRRGDPGAEAIVGNIDEVNVVGSEPVLDETIPQGGQISVRGWLLDRATGSPPRRLKVGIAGGSAVDALLGFPRPDVAAAFDWAQSEVAGFYAVLPIDTEVGQYPIVATAHATGGATTMAFSSEVKVTKAIDPLSGLRTREDGWAFNYDGFFVGDQLIDTAKPEHIAHLPVDHLTLLRLWLIDTKCGRPPRSVFARLGGRYLHVFDGTERHDAAANVGVQDASRCGFDIAVVPPAVGIAPLQVYAISFDGTFARLPTLFVENRWPLPTEFIAQSARVAANVDDVLVGGESVKGQDRVVAARGKPIWIHGWALDELGPRLTGGIEVLIDGRMIVRPSMTPPRPDVAELYGNALLAEAGFAVSVDTSGLRLGSHEIVLRAFSARGDQLKAFHNLKVLIEP